MNKTKPNGTLHSNIIANEFQFSPSVINYKIENHLRPGQKEAYMNQAELTAIHQERLRLEEEARKKQLIEERDKKIKENLKKVNQNKRLIELQNELRKQEEKQTQKEKLEKFNKELRNKIIKNNNNNNNNTSNLRDSSHLKTDDDNENFEDGDCGNNYRSTNDNNHSHNNFKIKHSLIKKNSKNLSINDNSRNFNIIEDLGNKDKNSHHKQTSYYTHSERSKNNAFSQKSMLSANKANQRSNLVSKDFETFSFNENEIEKEMEKPPQPTEKGNLHLINRELKENESVIDIRDDIDLLIKRKLDLAKNNFLGGEVTNTNLININSNLDSEENNLNSLYNHQRPKSSFVNPNNINNNHLKNNLHNNTNNVYNINTTFTNTSICDISSISNRKNPNSSSNLKNNLIRNIIAKQDNNEANSNTKLNSYSNNKIINNNNQNSFYNFSTNILSSNRINDSALSDFSNDNTNDKLRKTKSSKALNKNDFSVSKGKISTKNTVNKKSKPKSNSNLNKNKGGKDHEFNSVKGTNRISSANIKNSNSFGVNSNNGFFKITSTKKSVENNVKSSLINSKYFGANTQNTENDLADNAENHGSNAITNSNKSGNNLSMNFNRKMNETFENNNQLNNTNQNTSCISDLNIKSILEKNIDTVKNFRKTGLTRLPEKDNILGNVNEPSSFIFATGKNSNVNNTSLMSISNNANCNNNHILCVRKSENLNSNVNNANNCNFNNRHNTSTQLSSKLGNENSVSKGRESKSQTKINVNLQKRRITKALKNLMVEKFKEKNIIIPNICSCGQLQRKIDTLLENKNMNVYSIMNVECANNCIYYNNNTDYQRALTDIIKSVKNFKLENL